MARRPITRPSLLHDPKEAADIDLDTLYNRAQGGLDHLISFKLNGRFPEFKKDLFGPAYKEIDRELENQEWNKQLDSKISVFVHLISVHFQLESALDTLEYLIRRFKIHEYNIENLILCALPYHETPMFVRVVQLIDTGNSKWHFLDGVKRSGAMPPRSVIVQQCLRDKTVLTALCEYAKKLPPSPPMIQLCTVVVVEVLGSAPSIENDLVNTICPFVNSGLQSSASIHPDHKAGALMIVGLLASKATLSSKFAMTLIRSVAQVAQTEAGKSIDGVESIQWVHMSLMAMVTIIQHQSVELIPKKALELMIKIREFLGILLEVYKECKIDKFFSVLLNSLIEFSSEQTCALFLVSVLEVTPVKAFVHQVTFKILTKCVAAAQEDSDSSPVSGHWVQQILSILNKKYPSELQGAIQKFLKESGERSKKGKFVHELLGTVLAGNTNDSGATLSHYKLWFALQHPKADVRCTVVSKLNTEEIMKTKATDPQGFSLIQDLIIRQLHDEDLTVLKAAISLDGLTEIVYSSDLFKALIIVLKRCIDLLYQRSSENTSLEFDVALRCLKKLDLPCGDSEDHLSTLGSIIWPLLLILPKTKRLNLKVLEVAKKLKWPVYENLHSVKSPELNLNAEKISSINLDIVTCLAKKIPILSETFIASIVESFKDFDISKTLFFLVLMRSFSMVKPGCDQFFAFLEVVYPIMKKEWEASEKSDISFDNELKSDELKKWDCEMFLKSLSDFKGTLNVKILAHTFWRLLEAFEVLASPEVLMGEKWLSKLEDLFAFFTVSHRNIVFKEHRLYLTKLCGTSRIQFCRRFFTEADVPSAVQVESLYCFSHGSAQFEAKLQAELVLEFPSILVPLASDNKDVRAAAMKCIKELQALWASSKINGNKAGKILDAIIQQEGVVVSDRKFLPALMGSLLNPSSQSILVPVNTEKRFDHSTRKTVVGFIMDSALQLSDYAKFKILSLLKGVGNAVFGVEALKSFFSQLMRRRFEHNTASYEKLSDIEIDILCLLLEICSISTPLDGHAFEDHLLKALQLDGTMTEQPAAIRPCITVLQKLNDQFYKGMENEMQDILFREIVVLCRSASGDIQHAAKQALQRLSITCSTVVQMLNHITDGASPKISSVHEKKKKKLANHQTSKLPHNGVNPLSLLYSLLDILLFKKDIADRDLLMGPLFNIVGLIFSDKWVQGIVDENSVPVSSDVPDIQQRLLIVLKDISTSLIGISPLKEEIVNKIDIKVLVECVSSANDGVTSNHVFSLITSIAKLTPERVLDHVEEVFTVIGKSTISQVDRHSQHVFEELISTVVPYWLEKTKNMDILLEIFMNVLPEITEHRRQSIVVYLLRTLGELDSLASLLVLLFRSLVARKGVENFTTNCFIASSKREWEYAFAVQICEQYSCVTWLPSLVKLLRQLATDTLRQEFLVELLFVMHFTNDKLQDPEFSLKLESKQESENIQCMLEDLMEQIGVLIQVSDSRRKQITVPDVISKDLKVKMHDVFRSTTLLMIPSACFEGILRLLHHADKNIGIKALGLLSEMVRKLDTVKPKRKQRNLHSQWQHLDATDRESFQKLCREIVKTIDDETNDSLKVAASSALEVLAIRFPSDHSIFIMGLTSVTKHITPENSVVSDSCLRTAGALVNVLGPEALPVLPSIMKGVKALKISEHSNAAQSTSRENVLLSVLSVLEAIVDKLGAFLNPYLGYILTVVLNSSSDQRVKLKSDAVQKLIAAKIPVRLALPPLRDLYEHAVALGDSSLTMYFGMLANLIAMADRPSISANHTNIFDLCIRALDLRREKPETVQNIDVIESSVISTIISLTMKLTETMFRPLFIRCTEWAESEIEGRAIPFYCLLNKLAESHRSLFVPYLKFFLDGCIRHLGSNVSGLSRKKKKAKTISTEITSSSLTSWQLRASILSLLQKCFLYGSGDVFLFSDKSDSKTSKFKELLKAVVSQLEAELPVVEDEQDIVPSVKEVDDIVVSCVGQMAVAAGNELWQQLNHEVLMKTREEKVRARILGLRIVRFLVENLREEYMVELSKTIPFVAELLEDVEPSVKSLAQDLLKDMESVSGEDLRQCL